MLQPEEAFQRAERATSVTNVEIDRTRASWEDEVIAFRARRQLYDAMINTPSLLTVELFIVPLSYRADSGNMSL